MTISFNGLGSGLPINDWITALVEIEMEKISPLETKYTDLENEQMVFNAISTSFNSLQGNIEDFTQLINGSDSDLWGKTSATSSASGFFDITTGAGLTTGSLDVAIKQLATNTVAQSVAGVSSGTTSDTKYSEVANGAGEGGTLSVYVDNKRFEIEIDAENDTLGDIAQKISDSTGGKVAGYVDTEGKFNLSSTGGETISLGAFSDTSNFIETMKLTGQSGATLTSQYGLSAFSTTDKLTSADSGLKTAITAGTININGQEFEITDETTMGSLINSINQNADAGVSAKYDTLNHKLVLTSTETGQQNISLESADSNFFEVFGLTQDGALIEGSQTLGKNALLSVNGNEIISTSNTITSETTGIEGLTLDLKKVTDGTDTEKTTSVKVNVEQDTTELKDTLKDLVDNYNLIVDQITEATRSGGYVEMDSTLRQLEDQLRNAFTGFNSNDGEYNLLSQIGISTGKAGLDASNVANKLEFDEEMFDEAFLKDPNSVRSLLSEGTGGSGLGVFDNVYKVLDAATDPIEGVFKIKADSYTTLLSRQDEKINQAYEDLEAYEARITAQYQAMDATIAKMQQQYAAFIS